MPLDRRNSARQTHEVEQQEGLRLDPPEVAAEEVQLEVDLQEVLRAGREQEKGQLAFPDIGTGATAT